MVTVARASRANGVARRDADRRLIVVETKLDGLQIAMDRHQQDNQEFRQDALQRFVRLETADQQHTELLNDIKGSVGQLVREKQDSEAVKKSWLETIRSLPGAIKWIIAMAALLGGGGGIWQAAQAFFN